MDKPLAASTLNKVLAFGLAMTLVAWTFGAFFVLPAAAVDAHPNGVLVLSGSTVWKIMDGQRVGFPTANVYLSHGYNWGQIVPANSADLALPQGPNVMFADSSLVNDGGTVYIVYGGMKHGFTSAAVFTGLGYNFAHVYNESLAGYAQGADVSSTTQAHPSGTLVNASGTIWLITNTGRAGIPTLAVFNSWGLDFAKTVPANAADLALPAEANLGYRVGSVVNDSGTVWAITSSTMKQGFPTASCFLDSGFQWSMLLVGTTAGYTAGANLCADTTTPPTPTSTGTLSVSLASDTPASGIAIKGAARVAFTKVALTATGGDVVIDSWVVERQGVGQDAAFSSVDIINLSTNAPINDTGKTFNTDHVATFSEDFTVKSGETKYVNLAGNIANSTAYAGEQPKLALKSITLKGGSVNGAFPVVGNFMTINTSITIGTATVSRGAYTNASSSALEVGKQDYTFFSFQIAAGATEDISFNQVKVYQSGSASLSTDLGDFKLYQDGTELAVGTVSGNYVNFSFANFKIEKGQTKQFLVKADVVGGSARTVQMGLYRATDMNVWGLTYNSGITPSMSGTGAGSTNPFALSDNQFTISTGTLRVGNSTSVAAGNITVGSDQVLGGFEFEAKGESITITALTMTIASTTSGTIVEDALRSVKVVDSTGKTVAGPVDVTSGSTQTAVFSDSFTVPVGINVYRVVASLATGGGWASNDTITVSLTPSSGITSRGDNTGQTITASPTSSISANQQTVKAAKLTVTKNSVPTNKSVITNSQNVLAGSWTFDATDSGEDVRITTIAIAASSTGKLNALTLKDGTTALSPVNDAPTAGGNPRSGAATSTFALSSPIVITKGTSKVLDLFVNIGSNSNSGEVSQFGITSNSAITAYGVTTGNSASVTTVAHDGATLTIATAGTLAVGLDSSAPSTRQVVHGTSGVTLTEVRLKATNESIDLTKLNVSVVDGGLTGTAAGTFAQIKKVYLKKDGTVIGNTSGYTLGQANTVVNFERGAFTVPEGTTGVKLSVTGDIVDIGTNQPGTANSDIKVGLGGDGLNTGTAGAGSTLAFNAVGNGSNTTATMSYSDSTGSPMILHKAVPSVVTEAPATKLAATSVLERVKVSAVGNTVGVYRLAFLTTTSTGIDLTNGYIKLVSCGVCGGIADGSQLSATSALGSDFDAGLNGRKLWGFTVSSAQSHGKNFLQIAAGGTAVIDFYATVTGFTTNTDSVSTALLGDTATSTNDTGGSAAAAYGTLNQGNFVWTDLNSNDSDSAGLTTKQWYNGYYVTGLGATSTTTPITNTD